MVNLQFEHVIDRIARLSAFYQDKVISDQEYAEVDALLKEFATHILWETMPASGSTIPQFKGLHMEEIVALVPDMPVMDVPAK